MMSNYQLYPIQLVEVAVVELKSRLVNIEKDADYLEWLEGTTNESSDDTDNTESTCKLGINHSKYEPGSGEVTIVLQAETFEKDEDSARVYHFLVRLVGTFAVDESNFPSTFVEDWAEKNAPLVLYPYVREHIYSLASRVGISSLILPLLEIPTFKVCND